MSHGSFTAPDSLCEEEGGEQDEVEVAASVETKSDQNQEVFGTAQEPGILENHTPLGRCEGLLVVSSMSPLTDSKQKRLK